LSTYPLSPWVPASAGRTEKDEPPRHMLNDMAERA